MYFKYGRMIIENAYYGDFPDRRCVIIGRKEYELNRCVIAHCNENELNDYIPDMLNDIPVQKILDVFSSFEEAKNREGYNLVYKK